MYRGQLRREKMASSKAREGIPGRPPTRDLVRERPRTLLQPLRLCNTPYRAIKKVADSNGLTPQVRKEHWSTKRQLRRAELWRSLLCEAGATRQRPAVVDSKVGRLCRERVWWYKANSPARRGFLRKTVPEFPGMSGSRTTPQGEV